MAEGDRSKVGKTKRFGECKAAREEGK